MVILKIPFFSLVIASCAFPSDIACLAVQPASFTMQYCECPYV